MKSKTMFLLTIMLSLVVNIAGAKANSRLTLEITGLRNGQGFVLVSVFGNSAGFPGSSEKAIRKEKAFIKDGKAVVVFDLLPEGIYAIAVLHDENENLKMDTRALILPGEGYGFSKDARGKFGPPTFKHASFRHEGEQRLSIKMRY